MAYTLRHLRSAVERVAPNALEPVGGNRFHLRTILSLWVLVSAALASSLPAQTTRPPEQSFHFTVFSATPITGLVYTPKPKAAPTPLVFFPTARSPRYEFRGAMPLRLSDQATGAVVAEAVIPPDIREALLLLAPGEVAAAQATPNSGAGKVPTSLKYRVAVVDAGAAHHAAGQLAIINFSGLKLQGKINGQEVVLEDGLNAAQTVGRALAVTLHTVVKGRTFQAYAANLALKPRERALLILFPPYYRGSVEVQSRLLVDEPPAAGAGGR